MRTLTRLVVMALAITASLALLTGAASANRSLSLSPAGRVAATSEGKVTFEEPRGSFGLACNLILNGTTERVSVKRAGTHIGSITEGNTNECRDTFFGIAGSATLLVEPRAPFDQVYTAFLGTLPRINGILFNSDARFLLVTAIGSCLYATGAAREAPALFEADAAGAISRGSFVRGEVTRLLTRLSGTCPGTGSLAGRFTVSPRQTVRLL